VCRHLAYLGVPVTLGALLVEPEHSLYRQSWEPRLQTSGVVNADGFGVGWYDDADSDAEPARYRRDRPIWSDEPFTDLCRVVRSGAVLAAVRSASPGMALGEAAAAPFRRGRWLFSHNGVVEDYPQSVTALVATLPREQLLQLEAATDSAVLWALVTTALESGATLGDALAETIDLVTTTCKGRFNLLLTDGQQIAATAYGNSLFWLRTPDGVVVASEPHDDAAGWEPVPDRSLIVATRTHVDVTGL
jgi:glutamine amidotransferase